jgi:uncharacterized Zn finger protein
MSDLLIRVGNREGAQQKGRRYLVEGRVTVRYAGPAGIRAFVKGQGEVYSVTFEHGRGWSCSCPARTRCAHLVGVQLVTAPHDDRVPPGGFGT